MTQLNVITQSWLVSDGLLERKISIYKYSGSNSAIIKICIIIFRSWPKVIIKIVGKYSS